VVCELPPLRDRTEDLLPMATQFAERAFRNRGKVFEGFASDAEAAVSSYSWPGNVREMLNYMERVALIWQGSGKVSESHLSLPGRSSAMTSHPQSQPAELESKGASTSSYAEAVMDGPRLQSVVSPFQAPGQAGVEGYMALKKKWSDQFEREYLSTALRRHSGNVSAAAREAQVDRSNFLRLLRRYGLRAQEFRKAA